MRIVAGWSDFHLLVDALPVDGDSGVGGRIIFGEGTVTIIARSIFKL
jgi:hypothetical protein